MVEFFIGIFFAGSVVATVDHCIVTMVRKYKSGDE